MNGAEPGSLPRLALTDRDRRICHAVWSAGALDGDTLRLAISPTVGGRAFSRRLTRLVQHGFLSARLVPSFGAPRWLYSLGARSLPKGVHAWKPSLNQLDHTLTIGRVLNWVLRPGFAAPCVVSWWEGETEIRATASGDQPYPDLRVYWEHAGREGAWAVEVDRSTEPHAVWRRKMVRYLGGPEQILAITLSKQRASGLISVGRDVGVDLIATTEGLLRESLDPPVLSARLGNSAPLSQATLQSMPSAGPPAGSAATGRLGR